MAKVEFVNVTKVYDGKVIAVKNASLKIEDKEFVVLVGPSGCGKSTMLRMIAGLEEISSGELYIDDQLVNHVPPKDRDIAMVFQNYALYPHMTVFDNMAFGLKLRRFPREEIKKRVKEASEILGIKEFLNRKPRALSGGQRQRVAVGRAIVRKPKVFLFDEPLSNLDAKLRVQMRIEINRLHTQLRTTMIYVTHDQIEAMTMGDKIVVLKEGMIQQIDSPMNLYNNPANLFVAGFIGSPSMNFFRGRLINGDGCQFRSGGFRITLPGDLAAKLSAYRAAELILGIRPEHIYDSILTAHKNVSNPQEVVVDVVEPIGNEVFVYFKGGDTSYCMRMTPERLYRPGEKISIVFDLDRIYFFEPQSESRLV